MKTRRIYVETTRADVGCCGSIPKETTQVQSFCCGSSQAQEETVNASTCC